VLAAAVRLARLRAQLFSAPEGVPSAIRRACADAIPLFEKHGDHLALARAWTLLGSVERSELQMQTAATAFANASEQAHLAGDRALEAFALGFRALTLAETRVPVAAVVAELEQAAARFPGEPFIDACLNACRGTVAYDRGPHAQGRALIREGIDGFRRAGYALIATADTVRAGRLELLAGDLDEAERLLLAAIDEQLPHDRGFLGFARAVLAEIRIAQGRYRDALHLADDAEPTGGPNAAQTLIVANAARARAHARLGGLEEAKSAAAVAIAASSATDSLDTQARARYALAEVLAAADELPAALEAVEEADHLYATLERRLERRQVAALAADIKRRIARTNAPTTAA
jgi:tetratricopeptide (TPR) repeat protein